jgi:hypothetical protein
MQHEQGVVGQAQRTGGRQGRFAARLARAVVAVSLFLPTIQAPIARGEASAAQPRRAAGIEWLEIKSWSTAFGGTSFGAVGEYDAIVAVAHGKLDPTDPTNAGIVDLDKAPRVDGLVAYETDVVILKPSDLSSARRVLFYDVVNRGNKIALSNYFNEGNADLNAPEGAGNGFLMRQGYTVVFSGWQGDVPMSGDGSRLGTRFPVATNADGSPITGLSREEIVFDTTTSPTNLALTWPAATLDPTQARLRVKLRQVDEWRNVPTWSYVDQRTVTIDRPADMDAGAIYEFIYPARDPIVMGIGFAAVRDVVSFLKYDTADARGTANPLNDLRGAACEMRDAIGGCPANPTTTVDVAVIEGISQSGRFARDYLWQGFNADTNGRQVFDGAMPLIAGSRKTWTNFRFAQPGRWSKQHEDHLQAGDQFPFTYATTTDPISGQTDGLFARCSASGTCPRVMQLDGSGEFWLARASLLVSDGMGREVPLPDNVRAYQLTGTPHGYSQSRVSNPLAACKYSSNIVNAGTTARALAPALVDWIARGVEPPASRFSSIAAGTLADADSRTAVGFPNLSPIGVSYTGVFNFLHLTNYAVVPPQVATNKPYRVQVPTTDSDGNEVDGVRTPDLAVPLGTHMPWNPRKVGYAEGDQCVSQGSFIPFAATEAGRLEAGDPRPSLEERYSSKGDYVARIREAALELRDQRLMLQADVDRWVRWAEEEQAIQ